MKDGTKQNKDEAAAPTVDRLLRLASAKETTRMVEKSLSNPKASKLSDYKQNQEDKCNQLQSQSGSGRDQSRGPDSNVGQKKCHFCNSGKCPGLLSKDKEKCYAWGSTWRECGKPNHHAICC